MIRSIRLTSRNTLSTRFSTRSTCFSTRSTRLSTRSTRLSTRSTRLSTCSTRLPTRSICITLYSTNNNLKSILFKHQQSDTKTLKLTSNK